MTRSFDVGIVFPQTEIGDDHTSIRDFVQAVEELGYACLVAYDHVIGADIKNRPDWNMPYTAESSFHEPLTLFSYLAGLTTSLAFVTGILVAPQRQTVLVAKQAAALDIYSNGRLRLGVGLGWNAIEYEALGVPFSARSRRLEDQIRVMRRLWSEPSVSERSEFHTISEAGIKPLPVQQPIPILIGGSSEPAMNRAARLGDGWIPVFPRPGKEFRPEEVMRLVDSFREQVAEVGREPFDVRIDNGVLLGKAVGTPLRKIEEAVAQTRAWRDSEASGIYFDLMDCALSGPSGHIKMAQELAAALGLTARS